MFQLSKADLLFVLVVTFSSSELVAQDTKTEPTPSPRQSQKDSDLRKLADDLELPDVASGHPAPGNRVRQQLPGYEGTHVHHLVYLPPEYDRNSPKKYPVIFEYPGNGPFSNRLGDICTGKLEDCRMGYGISGGKDFIWVCLPFVSADGQENQRQWWGNVDATVDYCKRVVKLMISEFRGDSQKLLLCGFSRGSIACNYIGLRDDQIAGLWCGMICHSHYDGVRRWNYGDSDRQSAIRRLNRLQDTPQLISQESSTAATRTYLESACPSGKFQFLDLPFPNHTDSWLLKDCPSRAVVRRWVEQVVSGELAPADQ